MKLIDKVVLMAFIIISPTLMAEELTTHFQQSAPKYFETNGNMQGVCYEIITALNELLSNDDIAISYPSDGSKFIPFKRIQSRLEAGEIDVFVGMAKSDARLKIYKYIEIPAYEVKSTFLKQINSDINITSEEDLAGLKVGVVRGSKTAKQMQKLSNVKITEYTDLESAIKVLSAGRVDLVFYHNLGLGHVNKSTGNAGNLNFTANSFEDYAHYIAFSKSVDASVVAKVEVALKELRDSGKIKKIMTKYLGAY